MEKIKHFIALISLAILCQSVQQLHETHITIISPKVDVSYKNGQVVDVHFKVRCGEKLQKVVYTIADQNNKVLFSKNLTVAGKNAIEEKTTWTIIQTDPSVLTFSIEASDVDGHSSSNLVQLNVNF